MRYWNAFRNALECFHREWKRSLDTTNLQNQAIDHLNNPDKAKIFTHESQIRDKFFADLEQKGCNPPVHVCVNAARETYEKEYDFEPMSDVTLKG